MNEDRESNRQHSARHGSANDSFETGSDGSNRWDQLAPPPRLVPRAVRLRILFAQIRFAVVFALVFGGVMFLIGLFFTLVEFEKEPGLRFVGWFLLPGGAAVAGAGGYVLWSRGRKVCDALAWGEPATGRITKIFDQNTWTYQSYEDTVEQWAQFQGASPLAGAMTSSLGRQLANWPVKLEIENSDGRTEEIDARIDLGPRLTGAVGDPRIGLLVDRRHPNGRCVAVDQLSWLDASDFGDLTYAARREADKLGIGRPLFQSLLVVLPTYCLAAVGLKFGAAPLFGQAANQDLHPLLGAIVVLLFTLTHGVVPVFFYRLFLGPLESIAGKQSGSNPVLLFVSGFVHLHMAFWYGVPIIGLAAMTGWLSLVWGFLHVLLAGRGRRRWVFLEHGSTSLALVLFLMIWSGDNLFPVGVLVVAGQAILLTIVEWKGKKLWITQDSES